MKKQMKKLGLARETVRNLGEQGLRRAEGGLLLLPTYPWTGTDTYSAFCTQDSTCVPPETMVPSECRC